MTFLIPLYLQYQPTNSSRNSGVLKVQLDLNFNGSMNLFTNEGAESSLIHDHRLFMIAAYTGKTRSDIPIKAELNALLGWVQPTTHCYWEHIIEDSLILVKNLQKHGCLSWDPTVTWKKRLHHLASLNNGKFGSVGVSKSNNGQPIKSKSENTHICQASTPLSEEENYRTGPPIQRQHPDENNLGTNS